MNKLCFVSNVTPRFSSTVGVTTFGTRPNESSETRFLCLALCMLKNSACNFVVRRFYFQSLTFSKQYFIKSNELYPDHVQRPIESDLGLDRTQRLAAGDTSRLMTKHDYEDNELLNWKFMLSFYVECFLKAIIYRVFLKYIHVPINFCSFTCKSSHDSTTCYHLLAQHVRTYAGVAVWVFVFVLIEWALPPVSKLFYHMRSRLGVK